jgi:uridine kinase
MNFLISKEKKLLVAGLVFKLIIGAFFASYFLTDLFIPFVSYFVSSLQNPYSEFYLNNAAESFPYPSLMLYILATPIFLTEIFADLSSFPEQWSFFLFRLPLLFADIGILLILNSWLRGKAFSKLLWLYWFSPVLIYISYIHGQLDVIPIFFLFLSLDNLFKKKILLSGIIFGLALSTKTMVALSFPFIALYIISMERNIANVLIYFLASAAIFLMINAPFILDPSFQQMVFHNNEQDRIFDFTFQVGNSSFYIIPACLLLLLVRGALVTNFNRDIFIMFLGFAFGIILIFISPMQGWYFWLIPFLAYFYAKSDYHSFPSLMLLQIAYIAYFAVIENSDFGSVFSLRQADYSLLIHIQNLLSLDANFLIGITFTILQVMLGVNCYQIYRQGINSYSQHKITSKPFLLGIGGNSGVGKTTISDAISSIFLPLNSLVIRGDDMHRWKRGHEKWDEFTHLDPKANLLHKEIVMLNDLKSGKRILRKTYDHDNGTFTDAAMFSPKNVTIFEGLHPFYLSRQRQLYDLKIFIKPDDSLSKHWKITRDVVTRGYSKEKILEILQAREEDSKNFIESQSHYADIIISPKPLNPIINIGDDSEIIEIAFDLLMSNSIYLEHVIEDLQPIEGLILSQSYLDDDRQKISINGRISSNEIAVIANNHIPGLFDLGVDYPNWPKDSFGVTVLILIYSIFEAAEYGKE